MANSTADIALNGIGQDGHRFHWPVKTAQAIYTGTMVAQQTSDGLLVPASASGAGRVIGKALQTIASAAAAERCLVEDGRVYKLANGATTNAFSEASQKGAPAYAFDDHTVYDNSVGDTLKFAGYFQGMEADGMVRVFIPTFDAAAAASDVGEASAFSGHGVRGASTANIAALATFTVAGVDGLTYIAGERILLKDQTAPAENGIYVVGTVGGGTAPLTRALDADGAAEIVSGMLVHVSEGTVALNSWWALTTNAAITIDTTSLTFAQIPTHANLAATAGAGLIGILDSAAAITASTVEGALAELAAIVSPGGVTKIQVVTGTFVAGACEITVGAGQAVTAATKAFPCMSAVITGSTNVGGIAHLLASNVVGGAAVGKVTLNVLTDAGILDADAAGLFAAILIN